MRYVSLFCIITWLLAGCYYKANKPVPQLPPKKTAVEKIMTDTRNELLVGHKVLRIVEKQQIKLQQHLNRDYLTISLLLLLGMLLIVSLIVICTKLYHVQKEAEKIAAKHSGK